MNTPESAFLAKPCTAFVGLHQVASGPLVEVALAIKAIERRQTTAPILVFDDSNGEVVDLDLRGSTADIVSRLSKRAQHEAVDTRAVKKASSTSPSQGPGRPRLGVVAREVTLLPRHWEWLASQSGGASGALRRLVEEARLADKGKTSQRQAKEAAYRFLSSIAGDLRGFEEATRALFAGDWRGFAER
ncbi:MAG: DUF2239 family protein, partial [Acidobacteriaceae bacterium]